MEIYPSQRDVCVIERRCRSVGRSNRMKREERGESRDVIERDYIELFESGRTKYAYLAKRIIEI